MRQRERHVQGATGRSPAACGVLAIGPGCELSLGSTMRPSVVASGEPGGPSFLMVSGHCDR